jgi:hypothetical protein
MEMTPGMVLPGNTAGHNNGSKRNVGQPGPNQSSYRIQHSVKTNPYLIVSDRWARSLMSSLSHKIQRRRHRYQMEGQDQDAVGGAARERRSPRFIRNRTPARREFRRSPGNTGNERHFRHQCPVHPFDARIVEDWRERRGNLRYCRRCICYICCANPGNCRFWIYHCNGGPEDPHFRNLRDVLYNGHQHHDHHGAP